MAVDVTKFIVILDDGEFRVALNADFPPATAPGFLQRRCYFGVTTPNGYECVGAFEQDELGKWCASVDSTYDERTDRVCLSLGTHARRLDASSRFGAGAGERTAAIRTTEKRR